ncbi:MarR family transcriptional regulator [Dyella solisilvae]|uniref:MarR family transcriptional regulator n=1 Tax=Dyella solisilvae TaxID=1920168 RepID=A0A370K8Z0_9GAMM|nr:winged helix DNA-binding protein [Dyella solisilvae]RDI99115.1 MarR family transcriptional regulator [Dyella solisilvae]
MSALRQLGPTQQRLLRQLLMAGEGGTVESLCAQLGISHNAVRQHLSALIARHYVERSKSRPSGGRPLACYRLTAAGRALFPRNYGIIATALLTQLQSRFGDAEVEHWLRELGHQLGASEVASDAETPNAEVVQQLAQRLDALGYEAIAARHGEEWQVEAFNCVFHALARQHPQVCKFDLAYMEAATGRRIHHMECIVRGGQLCRFRVGLPLAPEESSADSSAPDKPERGER